VSARYAEVLAAGRNQGLSTRLRGTLASPRMLFFGHAAINSTRVLQPKSAVEPEFGAYFLNGHVFGPFSLVESVLAWACRERNILLAVLKVKSIVIRRLCWKAPEGLHACWPKLRIAYSLRASSSIPAREGFFV
jgi:hypothetical protein